MYVIRMHVYGKICYREREREREQVSERASERERTREKERERERKKERERERERERGGMQSGAALCLITYLLWIIAQTGASPLSLYVETPLSLYVLPMSSTGEVEILKSQHIVTPTPRQHV